MPINRDKVNSLRTGLLVTHDGKIKWLCSKGIFLLNASF